MSKVLLMVEREGRWVCASRNAANRPMWWVRAMAKDGTTKLRWKLVEAESAAAARDTIHKMELVKAAKRLVGGGNAVFCHGEAPKGRILASGGRDA